MLPRLVRHRQRPPPMSALQSGRRPAPPHPPPPQPPAPQQQMCVSYQRLCSPQRRGLELGRWQRYAKRPTNPRTSARPAPQRAVRARAADTTRSKPATPRARARAAAARAAAAARQPGRGRCVSIFLVKHTRCIGRSQSTRPAKKDATAAAPRSARRPQRAAQPARSASTAATVCADALGCARQPLSRCMPKPKKALENKQNEALQTAWGGAVEGDDR
jgi:hypothetical protein